MSQSHIYRTRMIDLRYTTVHSLIAKNSIDLSLIFLKGLKKLFKKSCETPYDLKVVFIHRSNLNKEVLDQYKSEFGFYNTVFHDQCNLEFENYTEVFENIPDYGNFSFTADTSDPSVKVEPRRRRHISRSYDTGSLS